MAFGEITGKWISSFPTVIQGKDRNTLIYSLPSTELEFVYPAAFAGGILFVHKKTVSSEEVCMYKFELSYRDKDEYLDIIDDLSNVHVTGGTITAGTYRAKMPLSVMIIRGCDEFILPNGTYYYLGNYCYL